MPFSDNSAAKTFDALGTLLLADRDPNCHHPFAAQWLARELDYVSGLDETAFRDFLDQARTQRVLRRILEVLQNSLCSGHQDHIGKQVGFALSQEQKRIETAMRFLRAIVDQFEQHGHPIMVIKTLDHWPDIGSDLDLLISAPPETVCRVLDRNFDAQKQPQSWADHLANKFNFRVPGLDELVEVHLDRLGQTGEQKELASGLLARKVRETFGDRSFPVPTPEDRIVIAALQRMYRHFYIRLTDIVNIVGLLAQNRVDFGRLEEIAEVGAVWPGVATLLVLSRHQGLCYGRSVEVPNNVKTTAQFDYHRTYLARNFVRVPILPEGANLFVRQLVENGRRHDFRALMRLSLLPMLATVALVSFRITGDDKGIW